MNKIVEHILVTHETYKNYIKENLSERLDKFIKIYTFERFNGEKLLLELFDKTYDNTPYKIEKKKFNRKYSNYTNVDGYQIWFMTDSDHEYRIDLSPVKNFNKKINSPFVWNISFTISERDIEDIDYDEITNYKEEKEVLLRIGDILRRVDIPKFFIIGNTELKKKIKIYKHILLFVFPDYNLEMSYCEGFYDHKGLYIWK